MKSMCMLLMIIWPLTVWSAPVSNCTDSSRTINIDHGCSTSDSPTVLNDTDDITPLKNDQDSSSPTSDQQLISELGNIDGLSYGLVAYQQKNYPLAFRLLSGEAESGNQIAQNIVGAMYAAGQATPQSDDEAFKWIQRSAMSGYSIAQINLGQLYESGSGVLKDYTQAEYWYNKARDQGDKNAEFFLKSLAVKRKSLVQPLSAIKSQQTSSVINSTQTQNASNNNNNDAFIFVFVLLVVFFSTAIYYYKTSFKVNKVIYPVANVRLTGGLLPMPLKLAYQTSVWTSVLAASFCLLLAFYMGMMAQSNKKSLDTYHFFSFLPKETSMILAILAVSTLLAAMLFAILAIKSLKATKVITVYENRLIIPKASFRNELLSIPFTEITEVRLQQLHSQEIIKITSPLGVVNVFLAGFRQPKEFATFKRALMERLVLGSQLREIITEPSAKQ